jgi:hypothetical protein
MFLFKYVSLCTKIDAHRIFGVDLFFFLETSGLQLLRDRAHIIPLVLVIEQLAHVHCLVFEKYSKLRSQLHKPLIPRQSLRSPSLALDLAAMGVNFICFIRTLVTIAVAFELERIRSCQQPNEST